MNLTRDVGVDVDGAFKDNVDTGSTLSRGGFLDDCMHGGEDEVGDTGGDSIGGHSTR